MSTRLKLVSSLRVDQLPVWITGDAIERLWDAAKRRRDFKLIDGGQGDACSPGPAVEAGR